MSRLAAASTIPVTNATRQENCSNSFRILMVIEASPVRRALKRHARSALPDLGPKGDGELSKIGIVCLHF
jgi:hypothetical protein